MGGFIFLQDGYNEGFKKGHSDAVNDKNRNAMGFGSKEGLKYMTGFTNREGYYESFCEGYNAGYAQGMIEASNNKKNTSENKSNNNKTNNTMGNYREEKERKANSFDSQIRIMEELNVSIKKLKSSLEKISNEYDRKINQLDDAGLLTELSASLRERAYETTNQKINAIIEHLESEDIPFIGRVITAIEEAKSRL